jgi:hypothetical protein
MINEFRIVMKDTVKSVEGRRFALQFSVHSPKYLKQPSHFDHDLDQFGNRTQVRWLDRGPKMGAWDSGIMETAGDIEKLLVR